MSGRDARAMSRTMSGAVFGAVSGAISRRAALAGGGALVVHFALGGLPAQSASPGAASAGDEGPARRRRAGSALPGSLRRSPMLDSWLRIDSSGAITVFTGKAELGQGIETALVQIAAEELAVEPAGITIVTADTGRTPDEGYTAGSHSMQDSGTAILNVAAQAREILVRLASERWRLLPEKLRAAGGAVVAPDGRRLAYAALVTAQTLHVRAEPQSRLAEPEHHRLIGTSMPRLDIPFKLTGEPIYVQDLRLPGMVHARVVRPPSYGAQLLSVDLEAARRLPGVIEVVHDGSYLAVVAAREHQAIAAREALARTARWRESAELPDEARLFEALTSWPSRTIEIASDHSAEGGGTAAAPATHVLQAEYRRPYLMHASIGPSCAVARFEGDRLTVWTHTQGVYPLRRALAQLLDLSAERVHCIQTQGSGCYGHNGADDAAADAALIARAVPGRAVRVQWMRADEHLWEPYGPAMLARVRGALDAQGRIASWDYEVWSNTHSTRPGAAGDLIPAWFLAQPQAPPPPHPLPLPEGGGDRNALPLYRIPRVDARYHFIPQMPLRVSALRSLGAHLNVFAIESFMDELARAAGVGPVEFRLRHLEDPRALDVIRTAAARFGWAAHPPQTARRAGVGRGFAFARYKNLAAYLAVAVEAQVGRDGRIRLRRAVAAVDCGEAVNPDGVRNQIEGGILQATSWTLKESVAFDRRRITSRDWASYPILRFEDVPDSIEVSVADRRGEPFLGVGEAAQGPTAAAIANAVADAAGVRVRELPLGRSASQIGAGIVLRRV